jgi:hypothetical protein
MFEDHCLLLPGGRWWGLLCFVGIPAVGAGPAAPPPCLCFQLRAGAPADSVRSSTAIASHCCMLRPRPCLYGTLTLAAARFSTPKARTTGSGIRSLAPPILKFCSERCVCAPQYLACKHPAQDGLVQGWGLVQVGNRYLSAGTSKEPMVSFSTRTPGVDNARHPAKHVSLCVVI